MPIYGKMSKKAKIGENMKKLDSIIHRAVHIIEYAISIMTVLVMTALLCYEVFRIFTVNGYLDDSTVFLKNILNVVVGLEFVRMLINLTPANTLEVLIVAIARQVIINHDGAVNNLICVLCIAGLFAIRRFLIPKTDLKIELSEAQDDDTVSTACQCEDNGEEKE